MISKEITLSSERGKYKAPRSKHKAPSPGLLNQSHLFTNLYSLRSSFGAQLVEYSAGMSLNSVFTDKQRLGNFPVAHSFGDELEDLQLTLGNTQVSETGLINDKRYSTHDQHFLYDHDFFFTRQLQSQPDTETDEEKSNQSTVDFYRVLDNNKSVFKVFKEGDQNSAAHSVNKTVDENLFFHRIRRRGFYTNQ